MQSATTAPQEKITNNSKLHSWGERQRNLCSASSLGGCFRKQPPRTRSGESTACPSCQPHLLLSRRFSLAALLKV